MNRRFFLRAIGTTTGALFLPDRFLLKAERFLQRESRPLLKSFRKPHHTFYAMDDGILHLGNPYEGPTDIPTWRKWFLDYECLQPHELTEELLEEGYGLTLDELDDTLSEDQYMDMWWLRHESSSASAYHFLEYQDIGPELIGKNGEAVGELTFYDCPCPGNDSLLVEVDGDMAISCLQWRLQQLGYRCNFEMEG